MNELRVFGSEEFGEIRTVVGSEDVVWFDASDVCRALEYSKDTSSVISKLDDDQKKLFLRGEVHSPESGEWGNAQKKWFLNESGLWDLTLRSEQEKAKKLRKFVTTKVMPVLVRTGKYIHDDQPPAIQTIASQMSALDDKKQLLLLYSEKLGLTVQEFLEREMKTAKKIAVRRFGYKGSQATIAAANSIKAMYGVNLLQIQGNLPLDTKESEKSYTPSEIGEQFGLSGQKVNKLLQEMHLQEKPNGKWEPTPAGRKYGKLVEIPIDEKKTPVEQWRWFGRVASMLQEEFSL